MPSLWDDLEAFADSSSSFSLEAGQRGTIQPKSHFNVNKDVEDLRKAMKGFGTDEEELIDILTQRSSAQRQLICAAYQEATGNTLVKDLKRETRKTLEDVLVALVSTPAEFDSHEVTEALKGAGTKEKVLIEIFASRNNQQIKAMNDVFLEENEHLLVRDLRDDVSGHFSDALLLLNEANRDDSAGANKRIAKEDATALYEASEQKWGTDECKFVEVLCQRSIPQLRQTLIEYKEISGKTLQESIEGEMMGQLENLMVAIVKCVKSVPAYFAEILYESMKGAGTDEKTLFRVMVSRSEIDLMDIRRQFKDMYGKSLHSAIESDLSGDCAKCMLAICGGDD